MDGCDLITDEGCKYIAKLSNLKILTLNINKITDDKIKYIADNCTCLKSITLNNVIKNI